MLDIAVVGAGPAGYSAAIHARKREKSVVVIGSHTGWLARAESIDNYPGLPGVSGAALLEAMRGQAEGLGAQLRPGERVAVRPVTAQQAVRLCRETAQQLRTIKELIDHD